jgi:hypothetical protein
MSEWSTLFCRMCDYPEIKLTSVLSFESVCIDRICQHRNFIGLAGSTIQLHFVNPVGVYAESIVADTIRSDRLDPTFILVSYLQPCMTPEERRRGYVKASLSGRNEPRIPNTTMS